MSIISIHKSFLATKIPSILSATDKRFKDHNNILSNIIESKWKASLETPSLLDNAHEIKKMEQTIVEAVQQSLTGQTGESSHLTKGEETAFEIKSYLLNSLEETMSIHSIAKKFEVSEKTIENSFKSLFGITPKHFIMLLKLNHTHKDLQLANAQTENVSDIAIKWGFSHFGRFSRDYKSLFGVLPSITLKQKATL
jgi:AraC family ethanolamine operon transcriptional activator